MADRTEHEINLRTKIEGARKAADDLKKITNALKDPLAVKALDALQKAQAALNQHMDTGNKGAKEYNKELNAHAKRFTAAAQAVGRLKNQYSSAAREQEKLAKAQERAARQQQRAAIESQRIQASAIRAQASMMRAQAQMARAQGGGGGGRTPGGFGLAQGFFQGAGLHGVFIQRGRGLPRQMAGFAAGRGARLVGRGAKAPFLPGGLGLAASAIPLVGDIAGAQVRAGFGAAQDALDVRRQFQQITQSTGGLQLPLGIAGSEIQAGNQLAQIEARIAKLREDQRIQNNVARETQKHGDKQAQERLRSGQLLTGEIPDNPALFTQRLLDKENRERQREIDKLRSQASTLRSQQRTSVLQQLLDEGAGFGLTRQETLQRFAPAVQARGGPMEMETARIALAAGQFGIGGQTVGMLARGARIGAGGRGLTGGAEEAAFTKAFSAAFAIGLRGSELNDAMKAIAENTAAIRETGIRFDVDSFGRTAAMLSRIPGISPQQALARTQSMTQGMRSLGRGGPRGAMDLMIMQTLGGLGANTDPSSVFKAMQRLEEFDLAEGGMSALIRRVRAMSGGGDIQTQGGILSQALSTRFGDVGQAQAQALIRAEQSGALSKMSPSEIKQMFMGDIQKMGGLGGRVDTQVAQAAGVGADLQRSGDRLLAAALTLEKAQAKNVSTMSEFRTSLSDLADKINAITDNINAQAQKLSGGVAAPKKTGFFDMIEEAIFDQ